MVVRKLANSDQDSTAFITVRFGNVLGSRGSVVPLFKEQIEKGGPLTVTHPEMTRYFMSIPEAVRLVLHSGAVGSNGDICILDMGNPVRILDLAENMILMAGRQPYSDIDIVFTGLRPGESLTEELMHADELSNMKRLDKIMISNSKACLPDDIFEKKIELLREASDRCEREEILCLLNDILPERESSVHLASDKTL